ncbi:MAG TPA: DUF3870 domain-containing protein [Nitrospiria bacterium]|nr:DUF3870 domain-containing protein [Nitrospiria bacterium]
MVEGDKRIVVGGQARLPKELFLGEVFQVIAEVEPESGEVVEIDFIPSSPLISRKLEQWIKGVSLTGDLGPLLQVIETRFLHKAKKAVMTAVKDLGREFKEAKTRNPVQGGPA